MSELNDIMEFDHVIHVHSDGTVTDDDTAGQYAPDMHDGSIEPGSEWTLLSGWSGQYNYGGPSMHASEFVGGRLAEHVLSTPGYWVTVVDYPSDGSEPDGWGLAHTPCACCQVQASDWGATPSSSLWYGEVICGRDATGETDYFYGYSNDPDPDVADLVPDGWELLESTRNRTPQRAHEEIG